MSDFFGIFAAINFRRFQFSPATNFHSLPINFPAINFHDTSTTHPREYEIQHFSKIAQCQHSEIEADMRSFLSVGWASFYYELDSAFNSEKFISSQRN